MNEQEFRQRFPNASKDTVALNADLGLPSAEPKPAPAKALVDRPSGEKARAQRIKLSYHARLVRPHDADNLAGGTKFITDTLVRCGLLDADSPDAIEISWTQEKVAHYNEENLMITINLLD